MAKHLHITFPHNNVGSLVVHIDVLLFEDHGCAAPLDCELLDNEVCFNIEQVKDVVGQMLPEQGSETELINKGE